MEATLLYGLFLLLSQTVFLDKTCFRSFLVILSTLSMLISIHKELEVSYLI